MFKLLLTAAAVRLALSRVDIHQSLAVMKQASPLHLSIAFLLFNFSKIISALRLNTFFQAEQVYLTQQENLKLYYRGMFYNLFLPGGIGGDGYKALFIRNHSLGSWKAALRALLLDRASGLVALGLLLAVLYLLVLPDVHWLATAVAGLSAPATYPLMYLVQKNLFPRHTSRFPVQVLYSVAVQALQVLCAFFLLLSLGIQDRAGAYLLLFLLSSVVSIIPITVGGIGARELVFVWAAPYAAVDAEAAVAFSLLFFLITAFSSLPGALLLPAPMQTRTSGKS